VGSAPVPSVGALYSSPIVKYNFTMSDPRVVRYRPDPANPRRADFTRAHAMTEAERHAAALADPDAQPMTDEELARMRRRPDVAAMRTKMGLDVEGFARRYGLSPVLVREWEAGTRWPDRPAQMLLRVIEREPEAVARVAAE
jgi:putative transcriptional regulator